jgi:hypothetical protein
MLFNGGRITRKELLDANYPSTIIRENMLKLKVDGFVIKITSGVYQVAESSGTPEFGQIG